jgi:hypothetical protein
MEKSKSFMQKHKGTGTMKTVVSSHCALPDMHSSPWSQAQLVHEIRWSEDRKQIPKEKKGQMWPWVWHLATAIAANHLYEQNIHLLH